MNLLDMYNHKFKIGQRVVATWFSGRKSVHIIKRINKGPHGYICYWQDEDGIESGLYEHFLCAADNSERGY